MRSAVSVFLHHGKHPWNLTTMHWEKPNSHARKVPVWGKTTTNAGHVSRAARSSSWTWTQPTPHNVEAALNQQRSLQEICTILTNWNAADYYSESPKHIYLDGQTTNWTVKMPLEGSTDFYWQQTMSTSLKCSVKGRKSP